MATGSRNNGFVMLPSNIQSAEVYDVSHIVKEPIDLDMVEAYMLSLPQVDIPVSHHFGPGVYMREITIPAGTMALGAHQRFDHMNILLRGKVAMLDGDQVRIVEGPLVFTGKPGRKIGACIEDCTWLNIFATDETDVTKLEEMIADFSQLMKAKRMTLESRYQKEIEK